MTLEHCSNLICRFKHTSTLVLALQIEDDDLWDEPEVEDEDDEEGGEACPTIPRVRIQFAVATFSVLNPC